MNKRIAIISQARMTSTRLPGKVLMKANGLTMLAHHVNRLKWSNVPIIIATTVNKTDDPIVEAAKSLKTEFFRGDENNVLERFYLCARNYNLDIVVRVTSDCPLIDGDLISKGLGEYLEWDNSNVYYSNCIERTFPRGLDFEIFSMDLLQEAFEKASTDSQKEHVTPYINQNKSGKVIMKHYKLSADYSHLRWTLDTPEDLKLLTRMFEEFGAEGLKVNELIKIIENNPELTEINSQIKQKEL